MIRRLRALPASTRAAERALCAAICFAAVHVAQPSMALRLLTMLIPASLPSRPEKRNAPGEGRFAR